MTTYACLSKAISVANDSAGDSCLRYKKALATTETAGAVNRQQTVKCLHVDSV